MPITRPYANYSDMYTGNSNDWEAVTKSDMESYLLLLSRNSTSGPNNKHCNGQLVILIVIGICSFCSEIN